MKSVIAVACILAAVIPARSLEQSDVVDKYMEYLMPEVKPCADQFNLSPDQITNVQKAGGKGDSMSQLGCMNACVMKRMGILTGIDFHMEPIYKMINVVHAGHDADLKEATTIADACLADIKGETDECEIGYKYPACYIAKLFA